MQPLGAWLDNRSLAYCVYADDAWVCLTMWLICTAAVFGRMWFWMGVGELFGPSETEFLLLGPFTASQQLGKFDLLKS